MGKAETIVCGVAAVVVCGVIVPGAKKVLGGSFDFLRGAVKGLLKKGKTHEATVKSEEALNGSEGENLTFDEVLKDVMVEEDEPEVQKHQPDSPASVSSVGTTEEKETGFDETVVVMGQTSVTSAAYPMCLGSSTCMGKSAAIQSIEGWSLDQVRMPGESGFDKASPGGALTRSASAPLPEKAVMDMGQKKTASFEEDDEDRYAPKRKLHLCKHGRVHCSVCFAF